MKRPRLFNGWLPTIAFQLLCFGCGRKGYALPWWSRQNVYNPTYARPAYAMAHLGWMAVGKTGPKGGERWHTMPMGRVVLQLALKHGRESRDFKAAMKLIERNHGGNECTSQSS
jgi:hypothetical protein